MTESFKEFVKLRIAESGGWFWGTTKKSLAHSLSYQYLLEKHTKYSASNALNWESLGDSPIW